MEWIGQTEVGAEAQGIQEGVHQGVRLAELDNSVSGFRFRLIHAERLRQCQNYVSSKRRTRRGLLSNGCYHKGRGEPSSVFVTAAFPALWYSRLIHKPFLAFYSQS